MVSRIGIDSKTGVGTLLPYSFHASTVEQDYLKMSLREDKDKP